MVLDFNEEKKSTNIWEPSKAKTKWGDKTPKVGRFSPTQWREIFFVGVSYHNKYTKSLVNATFEESKNLMEQVMLNSVPEAPRNKTPKSADKKWTQF